MNVKNIENVEEGNYLKKHHKTNSSFHIVEPSNCYNKDIKNIFVNTNDISEEPSLINYNSKEKYSCKTSGIEETLVKGISNPKTKDSKNDVTDFSYSLSLNKIQMENKSKKKLIIEEISGNLFPIKKFEIDKDGLINIPSRNKKDGITYFGINNTSKNDYILNLNENIINPLETIFKIYYNINDDQFYIGTDNPELLSDLMMFVMIEKELICEHKLLISLGNSHFAVEPNFNDNSIKIDVTTENDDTINYVFNQDKKNILIGRGKKCDIILHENSYSRVQSSLVFNCDLNKWILFDGENGKHSTNGSWAYLNWFMCIYDNLKIRIGPSLLNIRIQNEDG